MKGVSLMKIDAIIIAGGQLEDDLQKISKVKDEALIPIGDKIMVDYVISALENTSNIDNIVLVCPVSELSTYYKYNSNIKLVEAGSTAVGSVINGLQYVDNNRDILVCTGDIPLLTSEAVEDFIKSCSSKKADLFYSIIPKNLNEKLYPGVERTYVKLKDGTFTGGNIILVDPKIVKKCACKGEELVSLRKSPFALSKKIGLKFIIKYLLHILSLQETEEKFSQLLGIKGIAVVSNFPEVGIDVDKPSDLKLVKNILEPKAS